MQAERVFLADEVVALQIDLRRVCGGAQVAANQPDFDSAPVDAGGWIGTQRDGRLRVKGVDDSDQWTIGGEEIVQLRSLGQSLQRCKTGGGRNGERRKICGGAVVVKRVRAEEENLVALDGSAESEPRLVFSRQRWCAAEEVVCLIYCIQRGVLSTLIHGAVKFVGSALENEV